MIIINEKKDCCGCGGCSNACPVHCIQMKADEEGFLYQEVDEAACIGCGLCVTKCNFGALQLTLRDPEDTSTGRACDYQKRAHI